MRVILINGAPRSGKDTVGRILVEEWSQRAQLFKLAAYLKDMAHRMYGLNGGYPALFEAEKDVPQKELFFGKTPREVYIALSETYLKPLHGKGFLGEVLLRELEDNEHRVDCAMVTDSGFREEAEVLVRALGPGNVTLVRVHRPGCDFSNDSRSHVSLSDLGVTEHDIQNDGSLVQLEQRLRSTIPGMLIPCAHCGSFFGHTKVECRGY